MACSSSKAYLFTSFHEPADGGLRMLYSKDGYHWNDLDTILLKPAIGKPKIMRDPSMIQGPDGTFHLVWTTEWKGGNGFGYASSKDLINWTEQEYIPVMKQEPTVVNVWAPELFYDDEKQDFIIVWASCIPGRFDRGIEDDSNNHRLYVTTTKDFKTFAPTRLFLDPKFSVIDAVIVKRGNADYVLVLKDNTRPERNIKVAFSSRAEGPYENVSAPFTEKFTEGPAVSKVKDGWLIYYDVYQKKKYGASFTMDFKSFVVADSLVSVPQGHKHGTVLTVNKKVLRQLLKQNEK
ncbi:MAG: glycoside hydrolase family 43 protein [Bacteroidota bacterium]